MIDPTSIDYVKVAKVARDGSPLLLQALGRFYGLGPAERNAFGRDGGGVPGWAWTALAVAGGFVIGVRVYKKWPDKLPAIVTG